MAFSRRDVLKAAAAAGAAVISGESVAGGLASAFRGHGCFLYNPEETLAAYGNRPQALADAMNQAHMRHAWVRLHDVVVPEDFDMTQAIVQALKRNKIDVAGYGWCHGRDPVWEAHFAAAQMKAHGLTHYVANIEQGKIKGKYGASRWTVDGIRRFGAAFRQVMTGGQLLVSTYPYVGEHAPELMQAVEPYVDGFAPQIYWFNYPAAWMWPRRDLPSGRSYDQGDPSSYARLCLDMWQHYTRKPLVMTGQAYWSSSEHSSFSRALAEAKFNSFVGRFSDYSRIAGLNWWHLGGRSSERHGAMSPAMLARLKSADLGKKPYAKA